MEALFLARARRASFAGIAFEVCIFFWDAEPALIVGVLVLVAQELLDEGLCRPVVPEAIEIRMAQSTLQIK